MKRPIAAILAFNRPCDLDTAVARARALGCDVTDAKLSDDLPVVEARIATQEAANNVAIAYFTNEIKCMVASEDAERLMFAV